MLSFKSFPAIRFLLFGSLSLVAFSSQLRAQDLRQWMPNVGDVFIYDFKYSGNVGPNESISDTCKIVGVDVFIDSGHLHSVEVQSSKDEWATSFYYFAEGDSTASLPFTVGSLQEASILGGDDFFLDFSHATKDTTIWNSDTMETANASSPPSWDSYSACYSSAFRWFLNDSFYAYDPFSGRTQGWSRNLILAVSASSGVKNTITEANDFSISSTSNYLNLLGKFPTIGSEIHLLNLLGRSIRSWQMPVEAGERQITLNIADVPRGVYFLRVSGEGIDEVKKVCIAHWETILHHEWYIKV